MWKMRKKDERGRRKKRKMWRKKKNNKKTKRRYKMDIEMEGRATTTAARASSWCTAVF